MAKYVIKRLLLCILILFGVSIILYFLLRFMPVNYVMEKFLPQINIGNMTWKDLQGIMKLYGFDLVYYDNLGNIVTGVNSEDVNIAEAAEALVAYGEVDNSFGSIFVGYWQWLGNFLSGDMGTSFKFGEPVNEIIADKMGISFGISFVSLIIEVLIAIPLGIKCACNQYGKFDYVTTVVFMTLTAFPSFFLGNMVIKWFAEDLGWFPSGRLTSGDNLSGIASFGDLLWHLVLPMFVLVILNIGSLMRYTRTNTLEVLNADYIRTARAKGLSEGKVVYKHVFRNTLIPLVTVLAATLPTLFGGAMITEEVFNIDGIGRTAYNALKEGDIPLAMCYNMFIALLTIIGTLLADIMYAVVDPRVKLGK